MYKRIFIWMFFAASIPIFQLCGRTEGNADIQDCPVCEDSILYSLEKQYATGFSIDYYSFGKVITVFNPWDSTAVYHSYVLIPDGTKVPENLPEHSTLIRTPLNRVAAISSTHIGMFGMLGLIDKIAAVSTSKYVYNAEVRRRIETGQIQEIGELMTLNIEKVIELAPELVFLTGWAEVNSNEQRMADFNIKMAYNIEWMEKTPLGRAEWIKYLAAFFDKEKEADEIFEAMVYRYCELKKLASEANIKPHVLHGFNYDGSWYVPGGQSYIAILYNDAGADYYWKDDSSSGSLPLSMETVIDRAMNADFWFNTTMTDSASFLSSDNEWCSKFKAYRQGQLYCNNLSMVYNGGNDYWESGLINPDKLLADMIFIFHPELLPEHKLYYYNKVKPKN